MEYTEAQFLIADTCTTGIKPSSKTIISNPEIIFHNYSSIFHKVLMEINDKDLIRNFHQNNEQLKYYNDLEKKERTEEQERIQNQSILDKFINFVDNKFTHITYKDKIKQIEDDNIQIKKEYHTLMSKLIQPNEKLTIKTHALHYYMTEIHDINIKTQEICEDLFSKNQFLTLKIEETTEDPYCLYFHNWIVGTIRDAYKIKEQLEICNQINNLPSLL